MADIFLSYARDDLERVLPLVEVFRAQGWSVWWDREISAGKRFEQVIDEQIRQARCVVVAWSARSVDSTWVHNEALEGLEREILVPVLLDDVRVPVAFRQNQAALLIGYPDSGRVDQIEFLVRGVREYVGDGAAPDGASAMPAPVAPVSKKQTAKRPLRRWTLYAITVLVAALALWQWAPLSESPFDAAAAITELNRLAEAGNPRTAFAYARAIEPRLPPGALDESWPKFSLPISLVSAPPGGAIRLRSFEGADSRWFDLGAAPIENVRVANGLYHVQVALDGYATLDRVLAVPGSFIEGFADAFHLTLPPRFALVPNADNPASMVLVPGGEKNSHVAVRYAAVAVLVGRRLLSRPIRSHQRGIQGVRGCRRL